MAYGEKLQQNRQGFAKGDYGGADSTGKPLPEPQEKAFDGCPVFVNKACRQNNGGNGAEEPAHRVGQYHSTQCFEPYQQGRQGGFGQQKPSFCQSAKHPHHGFKQ